MSGRSEGEERRADRERGGGDDKSAMAEHRPTG